MNKIEDEKINKIVRLSIEGCTIRKIAQEVQVSKNTVLQYQYKNRQIIQAARFSEMEEIAKVKKLTKVDRINRLSDELDRFDKACSEIDLSKISPEKLFRIKHEIESRLNAEINNTKYLAAELRVHDKPGGHIKEYMNLD